MFYAKDSVYNGLKVDVASRLEQLNPGNNNLCF